MHGGEIYLTLVQLSGEVWSHLSGHINSQEYQALYILILSWQQNSVKSSQADSRVK
jgi:hypothetical protein